MLEFLSILIIDCPAIAMGKLRLSFVATLRFYPKTVPLHFLKNSPPAAQALRSLPMPSFPIKTRLARF
jgi:hypothetical protein